MKAANSGIYRMLMAKGIASGQRAGTRKLGRTNARMAGTSAADKLASTPIFGEEERSSECSPMAGNAAAAHQPIRIQKSAEAVAPASNQPWRTTGDPSMARSHPVLTLISSRQRAARRNTSATPCLQLIHGGKI